ncbi:sigma-54-dependent Fis family transcriptional regulator [Bacillus shivajii]|uniref:sigma-54 interaction domain-containing protein n=1 Tax=Bacillus shivajii TaxID=1983719 RepID=UPI001CFA911A|nr:sigma-54-dependent Fis family transcriptional regulator [Bacillus shivajii]UCZ54622.1 sigma-54-dependent Fis family transcriptional regulator [Bacillus shivajii]
MKRLLLIGAGQGGSSLLDVLVETEQITVAGVVDIDPTSIGLQKAKEEKIPVFTDWQTALDEISPIDVIVEVTGNKLLYEKLREKLEGTPITIIPSSVASMMFYLIEEKENLIEETTRHNTKLNMILNATHDGMIAIDKDRRITLINEKAEVMADLKNINVIGKRIEEVMPTSKLPRVLESAKTETNKKQIIGKNRTIITTRVPMFKGEDLFGALGVFRDITEIENMAEEVTNLKSIQTMLEAIIYSSDDAISVVDQEGKGLLINPAYTRLTGLTKDQVVGKPATTDISEGESVHMHVLRTKKPVRGVKMKVGPHRKDVIVNVAPIIVDNELKGSVGVIHDMSEIQSLTTELERAKQIIRKLEAKYIFDDIIGSSEEMTVAIEQAKMAAVTPATILLRGESGTGKELFAHAIHNASNRKFNKFIRVNCAAISETLLESELFGYEEGAFSGAKRGGKKGLFEEANGGSIFLDEIGEISSQTQAKLLRVLQEKEIMRVGGTKAISIDVRVIAATNIDMESKIQSGEFRSDLYYRLNRMPIYIPPLRSRKEDLHRLCMHLLTKLNQDYGRNVEDITNRALDKLKVYDWPGNVRELENILGRAMIHMHYADKAIDDSHIPDLINDQSETHRLSSNDHSTSEQTLQERLDEEEENIIAETLRKNGGNKTKTAKQLGLSVRNLYYKIEKHGIV